MASAHDIAIDTLFSVEKIVPALQPIGSGWSFDDSDELPYRRAIGIRARALAFHALCRIGLEPALAMKEAGEYPKAHCQKIVIQAIIKYSLHKDEDQ